MDALVYESPKRDSFKVYIRNGCLYAIDSFFHETYVRSITKEELKKAVNISSQFIFNSRFMPRYLVYMKDLDSNFDGKLVHYNGFTKVYRGTSAYFIYQKNSEYLIMGLTGSHRNEEYICSLTTEEAEVLMQEKIPEDLIVEIMNKHKYIVWQDEYPIQVLSE